MSNIIDTLVRQEIVVLNGSGELSVSGVALTEAVRLEAKVARVVKDVVAVVPYDPLWPGMFQEEKDYSDKLNALLSLVARSRRRSRPPESLRCACVP